MDRRFSCLFIATVAAGAALVSLGATRTFNPLVKASDGKYYWNNGDNWRDENGNAGIPVKGDAIVIRGGETVWSIQPIAIASMTLDVTKNIGLSGSGPSYSVGSEGIKVLSNNTSPTYWLGIDAPEGYDLPVYVQYSASQLSFDENVTGKGRFLKRGAGTLLLGSKAPTGTPGGSNMRTFNWHGTVVEAGTAKFGNKYDYKLTNHDLVFSGDDRSARIKLGTVDQTFVNVNFYETNGVCNSDHGFTADAANKVSVVFTGVPAQRPTVFSGRFYNQVGLRWEPLSAKDEFVCSNAVSTTTGTLAVPRGVVRLVKGASFSALSALSVGAEGAFVLETGANVNLRATTLTVEPGGVFTLGDGIVGEFVSATFGGAITIGKDTLVKCQSATGPDGLALADGRYTSANADWVKGAGVLIVGTLESTAATWTGAGADASLKTAANWDATPDLEVGTLTATFASGGSSAALVAGDLCRFAGLKLNRDFAFTAAAGATPVMLGAGGIETDASSATYEMGWPLQIAAAQTWKIGAGNTLNVNAPLSGGGSLTVAGPGRVDFNVASDYSGDLHLTNGVFNIRTGNACGGSSTMLHLYLHKATTYNIYSGVYDCGVNAHFADNDQNYPAIHFMADSKITFNGSFYRDGYVTMDVQKGAELVFTKGFTATRICKFTGSGHVVVTNMPMSIGDRLYMQNDAGITLDLWAANNRINGNIGEQACGRINTRVPYALVRAHNGQHQRLNIKRSFVLDLCGNDQEIGILGGDGGTIRSDEPALLHYVADWNYTESQLPHHGTNLTVFAGCAGLSKEGTLVPYYLNATSSTTGTLQVVAGELTMLEKAYWPNSTNVVVKGGTLHVTHKGTFGNQVVVSISKTGDEQGKLDLAEGVRQRCAAFFKDGVEMPAGTYGATGSGANFIDDECFTGKGVLKAGKIGSMILLR